MKQGPKPRKKLRIIEYGLACLIRAMKGNNGTETVRWDNEKRSDSNTPKTTHPEIGFRTDT